MSNFQPSLVINEGIATGWARVEVYGDSEYGKGRIAEARKVLGMLKSIHGVGLNQVESLNNAGGYYTIKRILPDGTQVQAITNDGHDTIRITTPKFDKPKPTEAPKRRDDFDPGDYLWIGIRCMSERPWYALDCHLVEPEGSPRGVVGSAFGQTGAWSDKRVDFTFTGDEQSGYELQRTTTGSFQATTIAMLIAEQFDTWGSFSTGMAEGDYQGLSLISSGSEYGSVAWSYNGICHQHWDNGGQVVTELTQLYGPYDPLMTPEQNAGGDRDFGPMDAFAGGFEPTPCRFGWDAVFWIDPWDFRVMDEHPTLKMIDKRQLMQKWRGQMRGRGGAEPFFAPPHEQVKDGWYRLVIHAVDTPPHHESTRGGETIPGAAGAILAPDDFDTRSLYCDYAGYMALTETWPPLELEVEVRIGRNLITQRDNLPEPVELSVGLPAARFNFTLTCDRYDNRNSATYPFGADDADTCTGDGGPNFGGPSYTGLAINVKTKEVEVTDGSADRVFGAGSYMEYQEQERRAGLVFIHTAFPVPADVDWPTFAGTGLHTCLELISSGVYGCAELDFEMSEGQCQDLFSGTSKLNVYMYDIETGALTSLGPATTTPADYTAYDPPLDSTNFYWYYEKAVAYQNDCIRTWGVVATTVGPFFDMSQNHTGDPAFTNPDCCSA